MHFKLYNKIYSAVETFKTKKYFFSFLLIFIIIIVRALDSETCISLLFSSISLFRTPNKYVKSKLKKQKKKQKTKRAYKYNTSRATFICQIESNRHILLLFQDIILLFVFIFLHFYCSFPLFGFVIYCFLVQFSQFFRLTANKSQVLSTKNRKKKLYDILRCSSRKEKIHF